MTNNLLLAGRATRRRRWASSASFVVAALLGACSDGAADNGSSEAEAGRQPTTVAGSDDPQPRADQRWDIQDFELVTVASLNQPISLAVRPEAQEIWVAERAGRIRIIDWKASSETEEFLLRSEPVLDIVDLVGSEGEGGLLGITFSANGEQLYVHYTDKAIDSVVAEYDVDPETGMVDAASNRTLLQIDQPFSNHNGGEIQLGPDGLLYIGLGDGGSAADPEGNGQNRSTLLGGVLRLDPRPDGDAAFTVPADNPLVGDPDGRDELWLWGVRNPWRFSFDSETGDLWLADVGQGEVEEINVFLSSDGAGRGANLGWNIVEGDQPFAGDADPTLASPIYTYPHEQGACSVTGGQVYRGELAPSLDGVYLFADYCQGAIVGLELLDDGSVIAADLPLDREVDKVIAFGLGPANEVFVMEQVTGRISRVQPAGLGRETITATR